MTASRSWVDGFLIVILQYKWMRS